MFIYQEKDGYCYNSDTLFLYDFISKQNLKGDVLDIGCGCGILGLLIKDKFLVDLTGIDIQKNNIFLSKINAKNNHFKTNFIFDDFLEYNFDKKFDFIISNPPFYRAESQQSNNLSKKISRFSDSMPLEKFIEKSNFLLKPRGKFIFCYDASHVQDVLTNLDKYKLRVEKMRFIHPKKDKKATVFMLEARKNSKSLTEILPPLITHDGKDFSEEVQNIYKKIGLKSLKCELGKFNE